VSVSPNETELNRASFENEFVSFKQIEGRGKMENTLKRTYGTGHIPIDLRGPQGNVYAIMGQARMTARDLCWTEEQTKALMDEMTAKKKYVEVLEVFATKFGDLFTLYRDEEDYEAALEEYEDGSSDEDEETDDEDEDEDEDDGVIARLGAVIARLNGTGA
jgi:hypothetical protein